MLRGKVEREMVLLSEGSSVKESPEDKQASAPCVRGSAKISRGSLWHSTPVPVPLPCSVNIPA